MPYAETGQPEHWALLAVFFGIVALCSLAKKPNSGLGTFSCVFLGVLALIINSGLLLLANRIGYGNYDVIGLLTLRDAAVESTLIVIGYALIVRAVAIFVRRLFAQDALAGRTYL